MFIGKIYDKMGLERMGIDMEIGITSGVYDCFGEARYREMAADGYRFCDLNLSNTETDYYKEGFEERLLKEKALAEEAGISFYQLHGPWRYPPQDETSENRAERLEKMRLCLKAARLLKCPYMVVHPIMPFGAHEDPDPELFFQMNLDFYRQLIPAAEEQQVTICIENMPMRRLAISPPAETLRLIKTLNHPLVKMCLDTGHSIVKEVQPGEALRQGIDEIRVLHVHDNSGLRDEHRIPYDGVIDWTDFTKALKETGFNGVLSIESELPEGLKAPAYRAMARALGMIARQLAE